MALLNEGDHGIIVEVVMKIMAMVTMVTTILIFFQPWIIMTMMMSAMTKMAHKSTFSLVLCCRSVWCVCRGRVLVEVSEDQEVTMEAFMDDEAVCCVAQVIAKMLLPPLHM